MSIVERYISPDGLLYLIVDLTDDDWSIGFEGLPWHTHGDMLTLYYGGSPETAARAFIRNVLDDILPIVLLRVEPTITG